MQSLVVIARYRRRYSTLYSETCVCDVLGTPPDYAQLRPFALQRAHYRSKYVRDWIPRQYITYITLHCITLHYAPRLEKLKNPQAGFLHDSPDTALVDHHKRTD
jgi:hypothetical protein